MGKSSRLRDITQWRLTQRAYELLCTCVVCVASVHVFDTFWAYNDVLKNDNKRAQVFWIKKRKKTTTTEEGAPKKEWTKTKAYISPIPFCLDVKKWEMPWQEEQQHTQREIHVTWQT